MQQTEGSKKVSPEAVRENGFYTISVKDWEDANEYVAEVLENTLFEEINPSDLSFMRVVKTLGELSGRKTPVSYDKRVPSIRRLPSGFSQSLDGAEISGFTSHQHKILSEMKRWGVPDSNQITRAKELGPAEPVNWKKERATAKLISQFAEYFFTGLVDWKFPASHDISENPDKWNAFLHTTVASSLPRGEEQFELFEKTYPLGNKIRSFQYSYLLWIKERDPETLLRTAEEFRDHRSNLEALLEQWETDGFLLKIRFKNGEYHHEILPSPLKKTEVLRQFDEIAAQLVSGVKPEMEN